VIWRERIEGPEENWSAQRFFFHLLQRRIVKTIGKGAALISTCGGHMRRSGQLSGTKKIRESPMKRTKPDTRATLICCLSQS